jgi:hypothetical protein
MNTLIVVVVILALAFTWSDLKAKHLVGLFGWWK